MHNELAQLCKQDQADRRGSIPPDIRERDRARRQRAAELIESGVLQDGDGYFHAALIFQHGSELADYWRAHKLALKVAELERKEGK